MVRRDPVFRVFVSSTFRDLVAERNALQEGAFKNLRDRDGQGVGVISESAVPKNRSGLVVRYLKKTVIPPAVTKIICRYKLDTSEPDLSELAGEFYDELVAAARWNVGMRNHSNAGPGPRVDFCAASKRPLKTVLKFRNQAAKPFHSSPLPRAGEGWGQGNSISKHVRSAGQAVPYGPN